MADDVMTSYPQVLRNVEVSRSVLDPAADLSEAIEAEQRGLGDDGRILVRASGTEPVVRVMVEADQEARAAEIADRLVHLVESRYS